MTEIIADELAEVALKPQALGRLNKSVVVDYEAGAIAARYASCSVT
jgi:hypothetical protein